LIGERWLLYYDREDDKKIMIFSTNAHLNLLATSKYWVMDGTFKAAPTLLCQIYAIHIMVHRKWVPVVMALLERKTQATYEALFGVLKNEVRSRFRRTLAPLRISADYEQATISAVTSVFPGTGGSHYQFARALWQ